MKNVQILRKGTTSK